MRWLWVALMAQLFCSALSGQERNDQENTIYESLPYSVDLTSPPPNLYDEYIESDTVSLQRFARKFLNKRMMLYAEYYIERIDCGDAMCWASDDPTRLSGGAKLLEPFRTDVLEVFDRLGVIKIRSIMKNGCGIRIDGGNHGECVSNSFYQDRISGHNTVFSIKNDEFLTLIDSTKNKQTLKIPIIEIVDFYYLPDSHYDWLSRLPYCGQRGSLRLNIKYKVVTPFGKEFIKKHAHGTAYVCVTTGGTLGAIDGTKSRVGMAGPIAGPIVLGNLAFH